MPAQPPFACGKCEVVPFEHKNPGMAASAAGLGVPKQIDGKLVRYAHIIRVAKVVL